jgi:hypothetical protein
MLVGDRPDGPERQLPMLPHGLSHGNAGIAYALLVIADLTCDGRFSEAARQAIEYERALFSAEHQNWPDLRKRPNGRFMTAWCHGAPDIALAQACSLRWLDDPLLTGEIHTAVSTTMRPGFGGSHILCHGDLGNVDILLRAAEILNEPRWAWRATGSLPRDGDVPPARLGLWTSSRRGHARADKRHCWHRLRISPAGRRRPCALLACARPSQEVSRCYRAARLPIEPSRAAARSADRRRNTPRKLLANLAYLAR